MRRIRHLEQCDYIIPLGQKIDQVLTLSNQWNCFLQRTWDADLNPIFEVKTHVKFNSNSMDGLQISAELLRNGKRAASSIATFDVYRIAEGSWTKTLVTSVAASESSPGFFTASVTQATLGSNELKGMECYSIECTATRRRTKFRSKIFANHLGCFDSIVRLQHASELLQITKVDF